MSSYRGYQFFIDDLQLPYAPSKLTITINSNNKTVELIDGSEINILKNPKLTDFEFEIELPRGRQYPFATKLISSQTYLDYFEKVMLNKTPVTLRIFRTTPINDSTTWSWDKVSDFARTHKKVSLEGYTIEEDAENAYDLKVSLKFKEYREYGTITKMIVSKPQTTTSSSSSGKGTTSKIGKVTTTAKKTTESQKYTIVKHDSLWSIARKFYGDGSKWKTLLEANRKILDETAKKYGRKSSSNGHWIYPGCVIIIPGTTSTGKTNSGKKMEYVKITSDKK
jgi:hypothetical protein